MYIIKYFQIVPLFVMKVMNWPGVPGLFLSSIFSGSLRYYYKYYNYIVTMETFVN